MLLRSIVREPLMHFLLAGAALFVALGWRDASPDPASRSIVVDEEAVGRLAANWAQTWRRAPTPVEIDGLIREYIREEVYYREAKRLGLDENDSVIRRRLRAKMEYLAAAEVESSVPDEATLQAWFARDPARYAASGKVSFTQVYLGSDAKAAAQRIAALGRGASAAAAGVSIALPSGMDRADRAAVDRVFGTGFFDALARQKKIQWAGPVASGFGFHAVHVAAFEPGRAPVLAEVRHEVENDWRAATRAAREASAFQTLLDGYTIRIEKPE
jgi:hypothetical protein